MTSVAGDKQVMSPSELIWIRPLWLVTLQLYLAAAGQVARPLFATQLMIQTPS